MSAGVEATVAHPLDPLSADEIARAVGIVRADKGLNGDARFGSITLVEPDKRKPAEENGGRRAELIIYDRATACTYEAIVSVTEGSLERWTPRPGVQSALTPEEYLEVEELTKAHPEFQAALHRRGIHDLDLVTRRPDSHRQQRFAGGVPRAAGVSHARLRAARSERKQLRASDRGRVWNCRPRPRRGPPDGRPRDRPRTH